jgi:RNA polymerase sigma-70 factor (ECF subfamily)
MKVKLKKVRCDEDLIRGCVAQNRSCQRELYERFSQKMFAVCLRYTGDYHTAEDLLQEGFVKVYQKVHMFRFEGSFEGWLRRVFVNLSIEHHRRSVHLYPITEVQQTERDVVDNYVVEHLSAADLMQMVQTLSPGYRTVFNLFAVDGYSHKEIAERLGITEGTSKSQLARARMLLQQMVNERDRLEREAYGQ